MIRGTPAFLGCSKLSLEHRGSLGRKKVPDVSTIHSLAHARGRRCVSTEANVKGSKGDENTLDKDMLLIDTVLFNALSSPSVCCSFAVVFFSCAVTLFFSSRTAFACVCEVFSSSRTDFSRSWSAKHETSSDTPHLQLQEITFPTQSALERWFPKLCVWCALKLFSRTRSHAVCLFLQLKSAAGHTACTLICKTRTQSVCIACLHREDAYFASASRVCPSAFPSHWTTCP